MLCIAAVVIHRFVTNAQKNVVIEWCRINHNQFVYMLHTAITHSPISILEYKSIIVLNAILPYSAKWSHAFCLGLFRRTI